MIHKSIQCATLCVASWALTSLCPASAWAQSTAADTLSAYRNPIIGGYHPDPSVCRVGDTFYLVNSTFQYFPGVPVSASRDLIHWQQIGNTLTRDSQLPLEGATSWTGIYAPTIRYHDGTYYMVTTNVGHGGNFFVTARDPRGPWSEPIWLKQGGIDPSFYFEDGKCYFCSNPGDAIWLCEIDPVTGQQLTESRQLWSGTGGRYPEGPHIYKKDGYYYLLISEGGTELAHSLTIARSRDIYGPYESNPANPILTNCNQKGQTMQIQGTGHGDFVEAADGSWWLVFLAYRQFGGAYHHLGRETYMAPVRWAEGEWPVINEGLPIDTVMTAKLLAPMSPLAESSTPKKSPEESSTPLSSESSSLPGLEWMYLQNPLPANYTFAEDAWTLRPHGTLLANDRPTYVGRRQEAARIQLQATVTVAPKHQPDAYGLAVYQIHNGQLQLCVQGDEVQVVYYLKNLRTVVARKGGLKGKKVTLLIRSDDAQYHFLYSTDGGSHYEELAALECTLVSTEIAGGFTGVTVGAFAEGDPAQPAARLEHVRYEELNF
jgi:alpha-N-arabinofuranosidase